ncbi:Cytidylyltransferase [Ancylostoma caninum]|uniref:Cytidylyltransferase n=1 Tax=Ancylostoma caninum TaxID=29170 RepID=A0A368FIK5_ANCCA|nr:Cytidylyltransferase [Ancylostoma caninum]
MMEVARDYLEKQLNCTVLEGLLSPVADSFNKPNLASAQHRLAMVEAATSHSSWLRADGWECRQKTWSRTLSVLQHHHKLAEERLQKDVRLALVVGVYIRSEARQTSPAACHMGEAEAMRMALN